MDHNLGVVIEQDLIDCARSGTPLDLTGRPDDDRTISAVVLRELYLGGRTGGQDGLDPRGPTIVGAIVDGVLDISHCNVLVPIRLQHCTLGPVLAEGLVAKVFDLGGSTAASLNLVGAEITGNVFLDDKFACAGRSVRMVSGSVAS